VTVLLVTALLFISSSTVVLNISAQV